MKKVIVAISFSFLAVFFVLPFSASAATNPGIKPGQFFYIFDTIFEKINLFFTFNPEKKAQKALAYADERLAEIEAIAEEKNPDAVKTTIANYENNIALAAEKSKEVKDKRQAENLLTLIADNASRNQEVLSAVLIKVPEEAREAIKQAIEASKKGQEEATKQIAELKGEVEQLKKEVAELKKEIDDQRADEVEKLRKEVEELKNKPAPTVNAIKQSPPTSTSNQETKAPPNTISCNGKYWTSCPAGQRFYCPSTGDAQCLIDNVSNQNSQDNSTQNQQREEAARQAEQYKINQINSLLVEYQQKTNEIDAQILTIEQQYSVDYEKALNSGETVDFAQGEATRVTHEANSKIYQLQLKKEALRLEYLNEVNSVQ